jgi:hypothetical protein
MMKEALNYSETSILTRVTRRNVPENAILHSHRRENLKSFLTDFDTGSLVFCEVLTGCLELYLDELPASEGKEISLLRLL